MKLPRSRSAAWLVIAAATAARADSAADAYRAMGIKPADVLNGTVLTAKVVPGPEKQVVAVTTYFTGSQERSDAVNVRLDVFNRSGEELTPFFSRNFGKEIGSPVGDGELQLIDLDLDGVNEIITSYSSFEDPLIDQRVGEVIVCDKSGFRTAWSGPLVYDATRAARTIPAERRDRFERALDFPNTLRTRGITLFVNKKVIAVAGERLPQPQVVQETFPLRTPPESR